VGIGSSGRIIVEIDPALKRKLYGALSSEGTTLKAWFLQSASKYLSEYDQPGLPLAFKTKQDPGKHS
jgi:hypothetical protein